jgi:tetraacyldisaccharide 4'-kinase
VNLYGAVAAARRRLYESGILRTETVPVPVVSVGNLTWGGTGKTPFIAALAEHDEEQGKRVGIVARGYRRRSRGVAVVSDGTRLLAGVADAGDEPFLLARRFPRAIVVVAERRAAGARAAGRLGADILLLDDGFQHLALGRDLDIVLVDANDPFGGGPPPAGRAREEPSALSRADLLVVTRARRGEISAADRELPKWSRAPVFHCRFRFAGWFRDQAPAVLPSGATGLAVCAVGKPESFRATLDETKAPVAGFVAFRDHHRYSDADVRTLETRARSAGASVFLTTEKDEVKLLGRASLPILAARIEAEVFEPDFFSRVDRILSERKS